MSAFCQQCSVEIFGEDSRDLAGLANGRQLEPGQGWTALCEDCGGTVVDDDGKCIWEGCHKHGNANATQRRGFNARLIR